jgi:hypothetical protein
MSLFFFHSVAEISLGSYKDVSAIWRIFSNWIVIVKVKVGFT